MNIPRRRFLHLGVGAVALPASSRIASAQTYPTRPITIVVPYAAGGPSDVIARVLVERMRGQLGQPVLVENVVGAGGSFALGRVARASPDGYTVVLGNWGTPVSYTHLDVYKRQASGDDGCDGAISLRGLEARRLGR